MRPVFSTENELELNEIANRLTDAGIPLAPEPNYSDLPGFKVGARVHTIQIWLDYQYEEALALIRDPEYKVKNPVDWDEFDAVQNKTREVHEAATDRLSETAMNWLVGLIAVAIVMYFAFRLLR